MTNKTSDTTMPGTTTLQRGKACLRCRKRKMRCDGVKPSCQQCTRAKKGDACEYDDGKGKTRTQILREHIARLEQRIQELEDTGYTSPPITLHDPHHSHQYSGSSSSSIAGSPGRHSFSASHSPFRSEFAHSPQGSWSHLPGVGSNSPFGDMYFDDSQSPVELAQMLLGIFATHRRQCGLEINMGRLRDSVTLPAHEQRHPALMNAIFLWACFVSRPGPLFQHETLYLARVLDALGDALQHPDKIVDIVQASCLLSMYFLSNGRLLEGSYHATAAASLAVQFGLHGGASQKNSWCYEQMDSFKVESAKDAADEDERVLAFWQAYNLDCCWSVVLRKPPIIRDARIAFNSINTMWPQNVEEYDHFGQTHHFQTTTPSFVETPAPRLSATFSTLALRVKASALFERADRLSSNLDSCMLPSNTLREEIQALDDAITRFQSTLIPPHQLDVTCDKHTLIVVHTLAHAAMIHLYSRFAREDPMSYDKCLRSARSCVAIIKHVTDADFSLLDPIVGTCWICAAETLVRELHRVEASWPLVNSTDVRSEIGNVLYALTNLSARFPLFVFSAAKIQKRMAEI